MFREIKRSEKNLYGSNEKKEYGYLNIKPETEMTLEECHAYIEALFRQEHVNRLKELENM